MEMELENVGGRIDVERYAQYGAVARIGWCGFST